MLYTFFLGSMVWLNRSKILSTFAHVCVSHKSMSCLIHSFIFFIHSFILSFIHSPMKELIFTNHWFCNKLCSHILISNTIRLSRKDTGGMALVYENSVAVRACFQSRQSRLERATRSLAMFVCSHRSLRSIAPLCSLRSLALFTGSLTHFAHSVVEKLKFMNIYSCC